MLKVRVGDIFTSDAQTLVNTVNCVGVMGKGIALEFKKRFPAMFQDYAGRCARGEVKLGEPYLYKSTVNPWILNFPTKDHWRSLARLEDIDRGLAYLLAHYRAWGITSIAFPPLGTGYGQLEWRIVGPILYRRLSEMAIPVEMYAPFGTPDDELQLGFLKAGGQPGQLALKVPQTAQVQPAWVALVEILRRVLNNPYHWPIGRISFQKMAYIAAEEGLPLGIEFKRGSYGPFSPDLKHQVSRLMNNGLITEERAGRMFVVNVGPSRDLASQAYAAELEQWEPLIARVSDLFMRTDTTRAELIATVLYAARELRERGTSTPTEQQVVDAILEWKQRRRPPVDREGLIATLRTLASLKWVEVRPSTSIRTREDILLDV